MIEIEYIVKDKQGVERLRTADKKEADAYDKALDVADRLAQLLRDDQVVPNLPDDALEELTIYLARNARAVERILKGKEAGAAPAARKKSDSANDSDAEAGKSEDAKANHGAEVRSLKAAG